MGVKLGGRGEVPLAELLREKKLKKYAQRGAKIMPRRGKIAQVGGNFRAQAK